MIGDRVTPCRALVAGFGRPGMRDLDFGRHVVEYLQALDWPEGVVVEDLSCSAPLVLHRLQELRPAKVILLGAVARDLDPPATLRQYRVDLTPPSPGAVHRSVEESVMGMVDLDHTLAMARHWGGLPVDTTVIEVEPAEASFGVGFSEALATCLDPILDMVCAELGGDAGRHRDLDPRDVSADSSNRTGSQSIGPPAQPSEDLADLLGYARQHAEARAQAHRAPALIDRLVSDVPGVALVGRVRPWGVCVETGGDWFDAVPLGGGALGIVVGSVDGRGVEAAATMSDLRAAARAYIVLDGTSPGNLLRQLDRLAAATGMGRQARLLYLTLQPATGEVKYAAAGGRPPLVVDDRATEGRFADLAAGTPLGPGAEVDRPEKSLRLISDETLLLFSEGLVQSGAVPAATGLERLRRAASTGHAALEDLCEHVLTACIPTLRRDDDICLVGVRLQAAGMPAQVQPSHSRRA